MSIVIVYILLTSPPFSDHARRFCATYKQFPPGYDHRLIVVCNDHVIDAAVKYYFKDVPCLFVAGDNIGQDIGAYQAMSRTIDSDLMICLGSSVYFRRAGWMVRVAEAFIRHGYGMYGASGSYQINPHLQTSAFWCSPELLRRYPFEVRTHDERYEFEHGQNSLCSMAISEGHACKLVTWDGEYDYPQWRMPDNCSYKGDQSNMLMYWNITDGYETCSPSVRQYVEAKVNGR